MKIINRKKSIKLIGYLAAIFIILLAGQIALQFSQTYQWVGFQKKEGSWRQIAAEAQGELSACQLDLQAMKEARNLANADVLGGLNE